MSKYLTYGWEKLYFILTPRELAAVLEGMHLLVVQTRVPDGYVETPHEVYLDDYRHIYGKLAAGRWLTKAEIWHFESIGVVSSLETHGYSASRERDGQRIRATEFDEPAAILTHFPMHCHGLDTEKPMLTVSVHPDCFPEKTVGLALHFPQKIQYPVDGDWTDLQSTKDLASYQDFLLLKKRIQSITKPLRVMMMDREVRTRVRVSPAALEDLDKFPFFRNNPVSVIR